MTIWYFLPLRFSDTKLGLFWSKMPLFIICYDKIQKNSPKFSKESSKNAKIFQKNSRITKKKFNNFQNIQELPKNSQDFENIQFLTPHLEAQNPFGLVDTLYVFSCTAYLVTPLDLVTVFWQTKCVTKSGVHCTYP